VAHASGSRFGAFASKSFPRILALTERAHEEGSETLRETCLRTIERFVLSCPGSITEQLPIVVVTSLALMTHDPLYGDDGGGENSDDDGNDDNSAMDDDDEKNGSEYGRYVWYFPNPTAIVEAQLQVTVYSGHITKD
jgi:hypothetical protein